MTRRAFVLPGWALVASGIVVLVAAVWLAWLVVAGVDDDTSSAGPAPTSSSPSPEPSPTPTASAEPTGTPEPTETPEPSASPEPTEPTETTPSIDRSSIQVSVLNASRTTGLARSVGQQVAAAGWTVGAVGNWRGYAAQNTVHYPQGREAEARLLAEDLGIPAVQPATNGMSGQRLTIVLVAPVRG